MHVQHTSIGRLGSQRCDVGTRCAGPLSRLPLASRLCRLLRLAPPPPPLPPTPALAPARPPCAAGAQMGSARRRERGWQRAHETVCVGAGLVRVVLNIVNCMADGRLQLRATCPHKVWESFAHIMEESEIGSKAYVSKHTLLAIVVCQGLWFLSHLASSARGNISVLRGDHLLNMIFSIY